MEDKKNMLLLYNPLFNSNLQNQHIGQLIEDEKNWCHVPYVSFI